MAIEVLDKREQLCPRCGGERTIPTPDGKKHQVCPICGGSGRSKEPIQRLWR